MQRITVKNWKPTLCCSTQMILRIPVNRINVHIDWSTFFSLTSIRKNLQFYELQPTGEPYWILAGHQIINNFGKTPLAIPLLTPRTMSKMEFWVFPGLWWWWWFICQLGNWSKHDSFPWLKKTERLLKIFEFPLQSYFFKVNNIWNSW